VELSPQAVEEPACVDRAVLEDLVGGDQELLLRIVSLFLEHGPTMRAGVLAAFAREDATTLMAAAHKLKGALGDLAARPAAAICERIELLARRGDLTAARVEREPLEREFARVQAALQELELGLRRPGPPVLSSEEHAGGYR
jgi:HPt (histidine-containing phosphotransfer) domain-containing protein